MMIERGDDGQRMITRKLSGRRGHPRKTVTVIVPEIILNERGLDSDLCWRMDTPS
jgi:hypothetical protein